MKHRTKVNCWGWIVALLLVLSTAAGVSADTGSRDCIIPPSGPWPACATGGSTPHTNNGNNNCVIPQSGPWPDCAKGGGGSNPPQGGDSGACVIPPSGPWPACTTGGSSGDDQSSGRPELVSVSADKGYYGRNESVTISWNVKNAAHVTISALQAVRGPYTISGPSIGSGTIELNKICDGDGTVELAMWVTGYDGETVTLPTIRINVENYDWFFTNHNPAVEPCAPAINTYAAVQHFERGTMIWIANTNAIYVLMPSRPNGNPSIPQHWALYGNTFVEGTAAIDPSLQPPAGLQQPQRGFGKVWRENNLINEIGWAIDTEQGFQSKIQSGTICFGIRCSTTIYILAETGNHVWHLGKSGSGIYPRQWSYTSTNN